MARYAIYDNASMVYTPAGEELTAEQWLNRHPWAKRAKMVISGRAINGAMAIEFESFVDMKRNQGCDFSNCETDRDYLDAIEAFEDSQAKADTTSDQTRIADALEDLVVLNMPDEVV